MQLVQHFLTDMLQKLNMDEFFLYERVLSDYDGFAIALKRFQFLGVTLIRSDT